MGTTKTHLGTERQKEQEQSVAVFSQDNPKQGFFDLCEDEKEDQTGADNREKPATRQRRERCLCSYCGVINWFSFCIVLINHPLECKIFPEQKRDFSYKALVEGRTCIFFISLVVPSRCDSGQPLSRGITFSNMSQVVYSIKCSTVQALVTEIQQVLWMKIQDAQAQVYWSICFFYLTWVFKENLSWKPRV